MMRFYVFFFALLLFVGCAEKDATYTNINGFTQGSVFSITYADDQKRNFQSAFDSILAFVDSSMSVFNDSSILSRINRNQTVEINAEIAKVINLSREISMQTEGAFDITIGTITHAIGFAGGNETNGIDTAKIKQMLSNVGMDKIKVENNRLIKQNEDIFIDLNAIAQGYTADTIAGFLVSRGVNSFIVEIGGEIVANGVSPRKKPWIVGVDKPIANAIPGENIQVRFYLTNGRGLATSGNYRKFVEVNGQKYSHSVNPLTGLPELNSLLSATVIATNASIADALGTAFMVKGLDWSRKFVCENPDIEAYLVYSDSLGNFQFWQSDGIEAVR